MSERVREIERLVATTFRIPPREIPSRRNFGSLHHKIGGFYTRGTRAFSSIVTRSARSLPRMRVHEPGPMRNVQYSLRGQRSAFNLRPTICPTIATCDMQPPRYTSLALLYLPMKEFATLRLPLTYETYDLHRPDKSFRIPKFLINPHKYFSTYNLLCFFFIEICVLINFQR